MHHPLNYAYQRFAITIPKTGEKLLGASTSGAAEQPTQQAQTTRQNIAMAAANGSPEAEEIIDDIIGGGLDGWEAVNDGLFADPLDAIAQAESYEDAILALASRYPDADPSVLATSLRAAQTAARAVGNATD